MGDADIPTFDFLRKRKVDEAELGLPEADMIPPEQRRKRFELDVTLEELDLIAMQSDLAMDPLVGDVISVSDLAKHFSPEDIIMKGKIQSLGEQYTNLRQIRKDGNSFFRSFIFAYMEHILVTQNMKEFDRIISRIASCKIMIQQLGFRALDYESFFTEFVKQIKSLTGTARISFQQLLSRSCDRARSNYAIMCLRLATSGEILQNSDFYEGSITGVSVYKFCKENVEKMGTESDNPQVSALSFALGVPLRVVVVDFGSNILPIDYPGRYLSYKDEQHLETNLPEPVVTVLKRAGHYDILYK